MRWSPGWAVDSTVNGGGDRPGHIVLSAGIDRVVEIDGLFDDDIALVHTWSAGGTIDPSGRSDRLIDQLIGVGAIISDAAASGETIAVAVVHGHEAGGLATAICDRLSAQDRFGAAVTVVDDDVDGEPGSDGPTPSGALVVALRTHERLGIDRGCDRSILHVDLRHEHTLVVGPCELTGLSACDTCYDTRLARRWPLTALPQRPSVLDAETLLAELISFHVERFVSSGTHLVNATIAHSLLDGTARIDSLLRVPSCNGCRPIGVTTGRVRLPWHGGSFSTDVSPS